MKTPTSYYIKLITTFLPRPITNDVELIATQNQINHILDKGKLTQDDRDYLKVLGTLVYDYEDKNEPMPTLKGVELLKALLEESNLQSSRKSLMCDRFLTDLSKFDGGICVVCNRTALYTI